MGDLHRSFKNLIVGEDTFFQPGQRNSCVAKLTVFFWRNVSFFFPKGIQYAHQGCSLSRKIVQVEQLESRKAWSSKCCFYLSLVTERLQFTGSQEKAVGQLCHPVLLQCFLKYFKIFGADHSGIFGDLFKIWIDAPLAYFVADNWLFEGSYLIGPVIIRGWSMCIDNAFNPFSPTLNPWTGGAQVVVYIQIRPSST